MHRAGERHIGWGQVNKGTQKGLLEERGLERENISSGIEKEARLGGWQI